MPSLTLQMLRWLRAQWWAFLLCSLVLLVPCYWHTHVQAADLGSHLYNASLAPAVARGELPGLHLQRQSTNILIDWLLSGLMPLMGVLWTQKVVASACVLVFFWGAFALASVAAERVAWTVTPLLAMVAYGAIFHWGFFNFYLSAGFSLFGLAVVVAGNKKDLMWIPVLLVMAALAHPMGAACLIAVGAYLAALRNWPGFAVTAAVVVIAIAVREYAVRRFEVLPREIGEYWLMGADQVIVFGRGYLYLAIAVAVLCAVVLAIALRRQLRAMLTSRWLQVYVVVALVVCFAPGGLNSPNTFGMMGFLPDRGSLYSAMLLCVLVAYCRPGKWFVAASAVLSVVFFVGVYRDTNVLEQRQERVAELVTPFAGERVISMVPPIAGWRIHEDHSVDRACIGRCYSYNNYEPSTYQFRITADEDNGYVLVDDDALDAIKDGEYAVKERDVPLGEVYQCGAGVNDLCAARLRAGQQNGEVKGITGKP
jgi:hypothetical protein